MTKQMWRVLQASVVDLHSKVDFTNDVQKAIGISPSKFRNHKITTMRKKKAYAKNQSTRETTKNRQRMKNQVRAHLMGEEELKTSRYKTEKIDPK